MPIHGASGHDRRPTLPSDLALVPFPIGQPLFLDWSLVTGQIPTQPSKVPDTSVEPMDLYYCQAPHSVILSKTNPASIVKKLHSF